MECRRCGRVSSPVLLGLRKWNSHKVVMFTVSTDAHNERLGAEREVGFNSAYLQIPESPSRPSLQHVTQSLGYVSISPVVICHHDGLEISTGFVVSPCCLTLRHCFDGVFEGPFSLYPLMILDGDPSMP